VRRRSAETKLTGMTRGPACAAEGETVGLEDGHALEDLILRAPIQKVGPCFRF